VDEENGDIMEGDFTQEDEIQDDVSDFTDPLSKETKEKQRKWRGELKTYAKKNNDAYFTTIGQHGVTNAEEIVTTFNDEQYASLIKDLKKACG
jgi:hypothetical protein